MQSRLDYLTALGARGCIRDLTSAVTQLSTLGTSLMDTGHGGQEEIGLRGFDRPHTNVENDKRLIT